MEYWKEKINCFLPSCQGGDQSEQLQKTLRAGIQRLQMLSGDRDGLFREGNVLSLEADMSKRPQDQALISELMKGGNQQQHDNPSGCNAG